MSNDIQGKSVRLLLIDHDPIFLLGLGTFLAQEPEFEIVAKVSTVAEALHKLAAIATEATEEFAVESIDLVILGVGGWDISGQKLSAIAQIQELHGQYPLLPLLVLDSLLSYAQLNTARQLGAKGYLTKGTAPDVLVNAIGQITAGESDWVAADLPEPVNQRTTAASPLPPLPAQTLWLQSLRLSANRQMNAQILKLDTQLKNTGLSEFDRFFLLGRRRELRVARWMVNQIFQTVGGSQTQLQRQDTVAEAQNMSWLSNTETSSLSIPAAEELQRSPQISNLEFKTVQSELFDRILVKLQSRLPNLTDIPLEIDILQIEKKQQLLYLVLRQFEETLANLRSAQVQRSGLVEKRDILLLDLWEATISEFFGKYSSLRSGDRDVELVPVLMEDAEIVKSSILDKIPQAIELFSFLLYQTSFTIENKSYAADSPEAKQHAEFILENLIIQMANGIVYPLLNRLADVEEVKQEFYDRSWITTREIERFRNNLSWRYRWQKYWQEPKSIFESQYLLLVFDERGIRKITSYAPRRQDLSQLNGVQQTVTLLLETRDAIAPRIQSMLVFVGSSGRYVLIQLGRGIGLIAQGIIQGIGNSLQEIKTGKNREP